MNGNRSSTTHDTILHQLNPLAKLFSLILIMVSILLYPSWVLSGFVLLIILLCFHVAGEPPRFSSNRVRFLLIFSVMMFLIQVLVTVNGTVILFLIPQSGTFGPFFPVTDYGLARGLTLALRFLVVVFSSMLFISVTDPTLLAHSLTQLRIPYRYAFSLVIALRFLPLFDSETDIVRMTQRSRGISLEVGRPSKILRSLRYTFFPLLVSALSRVDTLSLSMDSRGFGYRSTRTYLRTSKWHGTDSLVLLLSLCFLGVCMALALGLSP